MFVGVSEIELGESLPFWIILLNTSNKKTSVEAVTEYSKDLGGDRLTRFRCELLPGQFDCIEFVVTTTRKTKLKEYKIDVTVKSKSLKFSAAEKGIKIASEAVSEIIPYSGIIVSLAGKLAMKNEISLRKKIRVKKPIPKVTCLIRRGEEKLDLTLYYLFDRAKSLKWEYKDKLISVMKKNKHYILAGDLEKVVIGSQSFSDAFILLLILFKKPPKGLNKSYNFLLMFTKDNTIDLLGADNKYVSNEEFYKVMKLITEKPDIFDNVFVFV